MTERKYIDFYTKAGAHLVSREIRDQQKYFLSRQALYLSLGIIPSLIRNKSVIEFGPGAGHNTLYTDSLMPKKLVLVDGVEDVLVVARERLEKYGTKFTQREYELAYFEEYRSNNKFDFVIAEACVPTQRDPDSLIRYLGDFTKVGGVLLTTTVSGVSALSEILRQLVKEIVITDNLSVNEELAILRPLFTSHLECLTNMARSYDDWLVDNIVQTHSSGLLFSIPESIQAMSDKFVIVGSSPKFLSDWRWYRDITDSEISSNQNAIEQYYRSCINLLDFRHIKPLHDIDLGMEIEEQCARIWNYRTQLAAGNDGVWKNIWAGLNQISELVRKPAPETFVAIEEAVSWLQDGAPATGLKHFPYWWGRGQQYISFVRTN